MSKESKLLKNTAIIAIGNICTKCISFFLLPLYTSLLTTDEYGTADLINVYATLLACILTIQFEQGVFRYLIESRNDRERTKRFISTCLIFVLTVNIVFMAAFFIIFKFVSYEYSMYLLFNIESSVFFAVILQILRGLGDNVTYAIGSFINGSLTIALNVLFVAVLNIKVEGLLLATILSLIIASAFVCIKCKLHRYISLSYLNKQDLLVMLKYSLPMIPNTICWWVINASDRLIIKLFLGVSATGIYSVAYKFPTIFSTVTNIFTLSWTESAAENVEDGGRDKFYNQVLDRTIRFYSSANMGIITVLSIVFGWLVKSDFKSAYNYIPILMVTALLHSVASFYGSLYTALKKTQEIAKTTVLSAVINLIINISLINIIGIYAAALSSVVAYLTIIIIRHIRIKQFIVLKINIRYIYVEVLVYILVFCAYYIGGKMVNIGLLMLLLPYCIYQNKEVIVSVLKTGLKLFGRTKSSRAGEYKADV